MLFRSLAHPCPTGALWGTGALAEHQGWSAAFVALALLAAATAVVALVFYRTQERLPSPAPALLGEPAVDL